MESGARWVSDFSHSEDRAVSRLSGKHERGRELGGRSFDAHPFGDGNGATEWRPAP
jgi:hypothetical protein